MPMACSGPSGPFYNKSKAKRVRGARGYLIHVYFDLDVFGPKSKKSKIWTNLSAPCLAACITSMVCNSAVLAATGTFGLWRTYSLVVLNRNHNPDL